MDMPVDKVRKVLKIAKEPISLETPVGEEEDSHLGDFIEDKRLINPSEAIVNLNLAEQTRRTRVEVHGAVVGQIAQGLLVLLCADFIRADFSYMC